MGAMKKKSNEKLQRKTGHVIISIHELAREIPSKYEGISGQQRPTRLCRVPEKMATQKVCIR
jgi:hypothetical protein